MAYVSTIVSGAASLGVLIGLLSGIFFLVLTALKWVSRVRASVYEEELRRQKRFLIENSYLSGASTSSFLETRKAQNGLGGTLIGNNVQETLQENLKGNAERATHWNDTDLKTPEKDPNADTVKVREVIEKMVEKMIGGPLDGTTVGQLSSHSAYLDMFTKYHNLLCRELARLGFALHLSVVRNTALELDHADSNKSNLKRLIRRIISEAMALPNINDILLLPKASKETGNEDFRNKSYEDILATAILNKIIGKFQNKNHNEKENADGVPKPRLRNKKVRRTEDNENASEDDWSDTSRSDQLSLTIEEYIEEVTTTLEVSDDEKSDESDFEAVHNRRIPFPESGRTVVDAGTDDENSDLEEQNTATELITSTNSWEENWLFQKKRLRSTPNAHHPVPVPMLVPNPSEDYRALVGGVDADDLSDMSDCTDSVLEDLITTENPSTQTQNTEILINKGEAGDMKETKTTEGSIGDNNDEILDARIPKAAEPDCHETFKGVEECGAQETCDGVEEDGPKSPGALSQTDRESSFQDFSHQYEPADNQNSHSPSEGAIQISKNAEDEDCTTRCRMAEREKEKWKNPVPLAENPYSQESIEKREKRKKNEYFRIGTYIGESIDFPDDLSSDELFPSKKETEKLRFSRDYYVNASRYPSGMSSPCSQRSEEHEQKFGDGDKKTVNCLERKKLLIGKMNDVETSETPKLRVVDKKEFCLPSVKELAKQFAVEDCKEPKFPSFNVDPKLENKAKYLSLQPNEIPEKEVEVDYSAVPVSEIILNLQQAAEAPFRANQNKEETYNQIKPTTQMEIWRKVDDKLIAENNQEDTKKPPRNEAGRFNGKEVHSLTARSISKEFREGLKNNSYQKVFPKVDRASSGESDQEVCDSKSSPTPSIDLKNMKKFWEEIITANSSIQNKNKI